MGYLSKEEYDRRAWAAARRNRENEKIAVKNGMTQEQAELISELCSERHEIHCRASDIAVTGELNCEPWYKYLLYINRQLKKSGIEPMKFIPSHDELDYIDIDSIEFLRDCGDGVPRDEDEYDNWYDENYCRISDELEDLNSKIEDYLEEIDEKYDTHYAPTGKLRMLGL